MKLFIVGVVGLPLAAFALAAAGAPVEAKPPANRHQAVEAGREAFGSGWIYPWYDAPHDSLRRIDTRENNWWPDGSLDLSSLSFSWVEWVFWGFVLIVLAALIYLLVRVFLRRELGLALAMAGSKPHDHVSDQARIEELPFDVATGQLSLLEAARRCYAEGNYRQAAVLLFSHQLVELDKRHFIRLTRGKTNRQYLREIANTASGLRPLMEQTMVLFEEVFFGDRSISQQRFEACWHRLGEFDRMIGQVPS